MKYIPSDTDYLLFIDDDEWELMSFSARKELAIFCGINEHTENIGQYSVPRSDNDPESSQHLTKGHILYRVCNSINSAKSAKKRQFVEKHAVGRHSKKDLQQIMKWQKKVLLLLPKTISYGENIPRRME